MRLLLLSGSFHSQSRSLALLAEVQRLLPQHQYDLPDLSVLPFFSDDLNRDKPQSVQALIQLTEAADGIIICSPEYNHSLPAVLKNALDWLSRPAFDSVLKDMPVAIITQADSPVGGARAQAHIKLVMDACLSYIMPAHEMMVTGISQVFDADMHIVDAQLQSRLQRYLKHFEQFIEKTSA